MSGYQLGLLVLMLWAVGDVLTAVAARKLGDIAAARGVFAIGFVLLSLMIPFFKVDVFQLFTLAGLLAFLCGLSLFCGYREFSRALTRGHPSLTYAISSSFTAGVVAGSTLLYGEPVSELQIAALGLILGGIFVCAAFDTPEDGPSPLKPALVCAAMWTVSYVFLKLSMKELGWFQATLLLFLPGAALLPRHISIEKARSAFRSRDLFILLTAGLSVRAGDCLFSIGLASGLTALVAPLAGGYPVLAALISSFIFRERLRSGQLVGVVISFGGLILLAWG